jgi:hypothetical protein
MDDGVDIRSSSTWRSPKSYESMLALDRRALAWQCLCRDRKFLIAAASVAPASIHIMRNNPPIIVVNLSEKDRLAPWGVHFRAVAGPPDGGGLCRLAS